MYLLVTSTPRWMRSYFTTHSALSVSSYKLQRWVCVHACMCVCVHARMCMRECVCVCERERERERERKHTFWHAKAVEFSPTLVTFGHYFQAAAYVQLEFGESAASNNVWLLHTTLRKTVSSCWFTTALLNRVLTMSITDAGCFPTSIACFNSIYFQQRACVHVGECVRACVCVCTCVCACWLHTVW